MLSVGEASSLDIRHWTDLKPNRLRLTSPVLGFAQEPVRGGYDEGGLERLVVPGDTVERPDLVEDGVGEVAPPELDRQVVDGDPGAHAYGKEVLDEKFHVHGDVTLVDLVVPLDDDSLFMEAVPQLRLHHVGKGGEDEFQVEIRLCLLKKGLEALLQLRLRDTTIHVVLPGAAFHVFPT